MLYVRGLGSELDSLSESESEPESEFESKSESESVSGSAVCEHFFLCERASLYVLWINASGMLYWRFEWLQCLPWIFPFWDLARW